jgi:hypothetical protein
MILQNMICFVDHNLIRFLRLVRENLFSPGLFNEVFFTPAIFDDRIVFNRNSSQKHLSLFVKVSKKNSNFAKLDSSLLILRRIVL